MNSSLSGITFFGFFGIIIFLLGVLAAYGLNKERKKDSIKQHIAKRKSTIRHCRVSKMSYKRAKR